MKNDNFRIRLFIFIVVVLFSVFAVIKISNYQKENPNITKTNISTKLITTRVLENVKLQTTTTKIVTSTSSTTTEVNNNNLSKSYQGENFSISFPNDWIETTSQAKYLLISSTKDPTNLTVKYDEEINSFPGYQKTKEEDVLVLASTFKIEYWEPLALDDDFGAGSVNNLAIINLKKDEKKSLIIYSYQLGQTEEKQIKQFKAILDSFKFK